MTRLPDARMSGTAPGPAVLHADHGAVLSPPVGKTGAPVPRDNL